MCPTISNYGQMTMDFFHNDKFTLIKWSKVRDCSLQLKKLNNGNKNNGDKWLFKSTKI